MEELDLTKHYKGGKLGKCIPKYPSGYKLSSPACSFVLVQLLCAESLDLSFMLAFLGCALVGVSLHIVRLITVFAFSCFLTLCFHCKIIHHHHHRYHHSHRQVSLKRQISPFWQLFIMSLNQIFSFDHPLLLFSFTFFLFFSTPSCSV